MRLLGLFLLLACAACSTPGDLAYIPSTQVQPGPPASVLSVQVQDSRDEKPNRVATIRGGYGNPLKVLDTNRTVADEVKTVFETALQQRGMLAPTGPYRMQVVLQTFYGDQFMGRRAEINIRLGVFDPANRLVYQDQSKDENYEFTFFDNGAFASIEDLRRHTEILLNRTVDRLLDAKGLTNVLSTPPGRPTS